MHLLEFDTVHDYGPDKESIEIPVTLSFGERTVSFPAQLDTGATFCVFERSYWPRILASRRGELMRLYRESGV